MLRRHGEWLAADGQQDATQALADQCEEQLQQVIHCLPVTLQVALSQVFQLFVGKLLSLQMPSMHCPSDLHLHHGNDCRNPLVLCTTHVELDWRPQSYQCCLTADPSALQTWHRAATE